MLDSGPTARNKTFLERAIQTGRKPPALCFSARCRLLSQLELDSQGMGYLSSSMADRSRSSYTTRLNSEPLEAVRHLRVNHNNPETSTDEGLDFERCSALHNAIVKHAWQAEGYDLANLPTTTWWQRPDYASKLGEVQKHLPESLVEFLKRALHPVAKELPDSSRYYFFHLSDGLARPDSLWFEVGENEGEMGGIERVALYLTDTDTSPETLDGIM
jgi:hypothetical protein